MSLRQTGCAVAVLTLSASLACALDWQRGNATEFARITTDGRSITGAISPDGSSIAWVSLRRDTNNDGWMFFRRELRVRGDGPARTVAQLPPTEPIRQVTGDDERIGLQRLAWLPSGDHLLFREMPSRGGLLVRIADGATTRVGPIPGWFVLNDDWPLSHDDGVALNRQLQSRYPRPGESIEFEDLPAGVPHESDDWRYMWFVRSPTDANTAYYVAWHKHFEGCSCAAYAARRYLGIVDLRTGRMKRLTWGDDHTIGQTVSWTPDGSALCYLRMPYTDHGLGPADLHTIHPDGSHDRHVLGQVERFEWLEGGRMLAYLQPDPVRGPESGSWSTQQQLAVVDPATRHVQRLTKGDYHHTFVDRTDETYLVCEHPVGNGPCRGDLYLIRPLR